MRYMEVCWKRDLPTNINAIAPYRFEYFEEPSANAEKLLGYDGSGRCCYYQHAYTMTRDVLDDEDIFYEEVSYHESMTAWLLDSGQWLCCKNSKAGMGCSLSTIPHYELAWDRPR